MFAMNNTLNMSTRLAPNARTGASNDPPTKSAATVLESTAVKNMCNVVSSSGKPKPYERSTPLLPRVMSRLHVNHLATASEAPPKPSLSLATKRRFR